MAAPLDADSDKAENRGIKTCLKTDSFMKKVANLSLGELTEDIYCIIKESIVCLSLFSRNSSLGVYFLSC